MKCLWVYKTKFTNEGVVNRHKVPLVVKGFSWKEDINYTKNFTIIEKMNSINLFF